MDYRKERTGAVIGCGASHSPEYVGKRMKVFLDSIPHDSFKIVKEELGSTPYNRTPYSFVGDNFLIIGDTALLTNPMNSEGITWNFRFLSKIKDVVFEALRKNNLSITSLWDVNTIYQKSIGASSSYTRAAMKGVMDSSPKDNDFLYKNHIIFKSDTDEEPKNMVSVLFNGVRNKEYSSKAFKSLIKQSLIASKIKKHYEKYPNSPKGYRRWAKKADKLWMKAGHISDIDKDVI